ncbi:uncharacterized protein LOC132753151 [Ruditapes philippinarum]|uniref:uncharacterized protein LOC132753151 n=1 Tax=Ruditapes philippinarum TaxID=129788 RepID=UPI00295BDFC0|nr:uncharacterized protein LOC132753151 [Ruditapes philippinarum]
MECASTLEGNLNQIFFVDKPNPFLQHERTYWGFTVNDVTVDSLKIVGIASCCGRTDIIDRLLRHTNQLNTHESEKFTVLHYASYLGSKNIVEYIVKAGTDINAQSAKGDTALHFATIQGHYEIVQILIENGAECNIQNKKGWSAPMLATPIQGNDCLYELIKAGLDVNLQDKEGKAALHYASLSKGSEKVKALIEAGADINILSNAGDTALHHAALIGSNRSVNKLIQSGVGINTENHFGQTALHLSLRQYNFEVFETLLINQASICIRDKEEYDPLRYMYNNESALLQIFKLHHYLQSYTDVYGNTILHLLVENFRQAGPFQEIWSYIIYNYTEFSIYLPKQNMFGQTILHIAATKYKKGNVLLQMIFSFFEQYIQNVLLLHDENGNTFLHQILNATLFQVTFSDFLPYLENETVKQKLLASRNYVGNTLLHVAYIVEDLQIVDSVETCSVLEIVGASINAQNNLGETGFQRLIYFHKRYPELIRAVMEKGPEINVQNIFGETELFVISDGYSRLAIKDIKLLSNLKSNITFCNRIGQTMIMAHPYNWFSWISKLKSKAHLNKQDIFKNNVLHYIACDEEIEKLFSTYDVEENVLEFISTISVNEDKLGQLPCDVALLRGHINILEHICVCKNGVHKKKPIFFQRFLEINAIKQRNQSFENCVRSLSGYCTERTIENIISEPFIGLIQFKKDKNDTDVDSFDKEATEVKNAIEHIVQKICTRLSEKEKLFANKVILSGSVGEDTKVGLPNEFDFICLLVEMSNWLVIEESEGNDVQVKLKKKYRHGKCSRFFNSHSFKDINDRFYAIITEILQEPDIYSHQNLFRKSLTLLAPRGGPNFTLRFKWCGCKYKNMTVKVDLVPAFQIPHETKLFSSNFNLVKNNSKFVMGRDTFENSTTLWYVSAVNEENERYATLSSEAKKAYVISKILCSKRVCPIVICDDTINGGKEEIEKCGDVISSYMLKNCLFYVAKETQGNSISNLCVHDYVCRIFQKLLQFCRQETLPIFMFHNINLFRYPFKREERKKKRVIIAMYAKLILNILGKYCDFDDIYLDYTSDEFKNRKVLNLIEDNNICAQCKKTPGRDRVTLIACTKCKLWTYCSDTCKNRNHKRHKPACDYHYMLGVC